MEQKNRIDHYKIQSVLLWFGICFLLQILLLLMQEFQYDGEHYQPLLYLFGKKYGKNAFLCDIRNHDVSDAVDILYHGNSQDCKKKRRECIYDNTKV